jgi:hypothetical protein
MSTRITVKDVRTQFTRATKAAQAVGLTTEHWAVDMGSKTNGRAYRLYALDPDTGSHSNTPLMSDFLGMTAKEAHSTLAAYAYAWEAVAYIRDNPSTPSYDYEVQGDYGFGYEMVTTYPTRAEALVGISEYRANESYPFRIVRHEL